MSTSTTETVITREQNTLPNAQRSAQTSARSTTSVQTSATTLLTQFILFSLGALEVLLGFRFILKLLGASQSSGFVTFIYSLSKLFIMPFEGIFRRGVTQGIETAAVIEPATIVAAIVYAIVAWGIIALIRMLSRDSQVE